MVLRNGKKKDTPWNNFQLSIINFQKAPISLELFDWKLEICH